VVIVDDMVDTAGTLNSLSKRLDGMGARNVYVCASHGLFTEHSSELITESPVKRVVVTNTLPLPKNISSKVEQVTVAPMLAHIILAEHFRTAQYEPDEEFQMDD
jgi:ribose-phosphate pyrophosphokinase